MQLHHSSKTIRFRFIYSFFFMIVVAGLGTGNLIAEELLIQNATVYDGSNQPGQILDVLVSGDKIKSIGKNLTPPDAQIRRIDATGLLLAPGFIDLHNHSDTSIVAESTKSNLNYTKQGVTTIVTGNCGGGATDTSKLYNQIAQRGAGTNVAHLIPHGSLRELVMGNADREPTADELQKMQSIINREMQNGAWGISTGLIYIPGKFAKTSELIALSKTVNNHHGIYASHIRSEGSDLIEAIDEAIEIGRASKIPVHISHLKASGKLNWGKIVEACDHIQAARKTGMKVTADQYPYVASSTRLSAMVVSDWARVLNAKQLNEKLADPKARMQLAAEIKNQMPSRDGGNSIMISRFASKPEYVGKRLDEIAKIEKKPVEEIVIEIQLAGDCGAISFGMTEADVQFGMKKDWVATASDGGAHIPGSGDKPHPRAYGTFPRKIRYAIDDKVIPLEQAIYAATALPADILGLKDRGRIAPGLIADIVIFDPQTFRDKSTFTDSTQYADGVHYLLVNGILVIDQQKPTGNLPGRGLLHPNSRQATAVIEADFIWTGDDKRPSASAIAIRDNEIIGVGNSDDFKSLIGPDTKRIQYPRNAMIVPGIIDSHAHLSMLGANLDELDLREMKSESEVATAVKQWADKRPGKGWIIGRNWDQSLWPGQVFPTSKSLDQVLPDRPVWLIRVDGHAGWANSNAMRQAKAYRNAIVPPDGQMITDKNADPTGLFIDGAMALVSYAIPAINDETLKNRILFAQAECLKSGLTGVHDAGLDAQERRVLEQLDRYGQLKLRVYGMASSPDPVSFFRTYTPGLHFAGSGRYELRAFKLFIDGAMGSRGALMFEPYSDDPENKGLQLYHLKSFQLALETALETGWQVCTHAIGDRGNALVLDAYEQAMKQVPQSKRSIPNPRWRVEHAQVMRRSDVQRFARSGIIASMQPSHASSDQRWADLRLGPERVRGAYAWNWFVEDGVTLAFGSDFPVEVVSPLWGIYGGLTRKAADGTPPSGWHPEHRLSIDLVLKGFTSGSAYAQFAEDRLGKIQAGFRADFVVFDRNLLKTEESDILKIKTLATWIDGEAVFQNLP